MFILFRAADFEAITIPYPFTMCQQCTFNLSPGFIPPFCLCHSSFFFTITRFSLSSRGVRFMANGINSYLMAYQ